MRITYKNSGVDIEKGERFAGFISSINSRAVDVSGGFAGGIELDLKKYSNPVLMSCTDGVGTKLLVARNLKKFDTIGIDLVAMSVNDLIVCGAEPVSFLDYIACGKLDEEILKEIIKGIVEGCEQAGCVLSGGETAEMPDLYSENDFDLAGFCTGIAEKSSILPKKAEIKRGDTILGIPSEGIHSNGLSLARRVLDEKHPLYPELLKPTKIYVKDFRKLLSSGMVLAAAHITGGGLEANTARVIPDKFRQKLYWDWDVPAIFSAIREAGGIEEQEMRRVFNMGIGISLIVAGDKSSELISYGRENNINVIKIGEIDETQKP